MENIYISETMLVIIIIIFVIIACGLFMYLGYRKAKRDYMEDIHSKALEYILEIEEKITNGTFDYEKELEKVKEVKLDE